MEEAYVGYSVPYWGFTIQPDANGNQHFLLADGTVVHNSSKDSFKHGSKPTSKSRAADDDD